MLNYFFKKKNINNRSSFIKTAFTLTEVIIATFISMIVLGFIFLFLTNTIDGIWNTKKEINIMSSFYDFTNKINNLRNVYITWWVLINNSTWSEVFLMKDSKLESWILISAVKLVNNKIYIDIDTYENKGLWFRKVSKSELSDIDTDINVIYNYLFQPDQVFYDLKVYDIKFDSYNSWSIFDLTLFLDMNFNDSLIWELWSTLPKDSLKQFNIDF